MSTDPHVFKLLPAYALGCLDEDEVEVVVEHLEDCPTCQAELQTYQHLSEELAFATPEATPPAALQDKLMDALQSTPPTTSSPSHSSWWQGLVDRLRRPGLAWSLAGLTLIVVAAIAYLWLWQSSPPAPMQTVALQGTEVVPEAQGLIVVSSDGTRGTLVVENLPQLDAAHEYQLWLIEDGQRTSGAVFSVGSNGYTATIIWAPQPLDLYSAFGITIEPAGGSPGPTGDKVLGGAF
jgi:anti-sigma-K factor RskA